MKDNFITFISNSVKGIQTLQQRMKLFEYLKSYVATKEFVFFRKHIHQLEMKRNGKMNSGASSFF